jgi:hypothetical protein
MRRPWLLIACTLAGMFAGLWIGAFVLERFGISRLSGLPHGAIAAMEERELEQRRLCRTLGIALGGAAGLIAYDATMRWQRKKCGPAPVDDDHAAN